MMEVGLLACEVGLLEQMILIQKFMALFGSTCNHLKSYTVKFSNFCKFQVWFK